MFFTIHIKFHKKKTYIYDYMINYDQLKPYLEPQTTIKKWMFGDFQPFPM